MATAEVVVRGRYVSDASQGAPIEPRAILAQWQGDKVTVWSSTQVPFAARSGIAHTLDLPESQVRVIVPLLGGGFGSKCDFHFEAHIAALARATRRPVKLVFSRQEEFFAPDHRREGMVIELETGVTREGRLVARRGRLVLDKGAYCGEGGFFAQMAAMHACGPYKIDNIDIDSYLNYSTNQPSSSVRAPTAPQTCWALEQHMDEVAAAIGMDPAELRRRTLIDEGDEGPTGQVFEEIGAKRTLEAALEMIGYGQKLPDDEAIGIACGWWPSFGVEFRRLHQAQRRRHRDHHHRRHGIGDRGRHGAADPCGRSSGDEARGLLHPLSGHRRRAWDMGSSGSQTTFNNGRAVIEAAKEVRQKLLDMAAEELEAAPEDLELVAGEVRVKGSPDKAVTIAQPGRNRGGHPRKGIR